MWLYNGQGSHIFLGVSFNFELSFYKVATYFYFCFLKIIFDYLWLQALMELCDRFLYLFVFAEMCPVKCKF